MRAIVTSSTIVFGALFLAACSSPPTIEQKPIAPVVSSSPKADSRTVVPVAVSDDPLNDPKGILAKRSVYFDFDSYIVQKEYQPVLAAHAKYLSGAKTKKIVIQGNTDERGGREYNLALGQKRAEAVRKTMSASGTPDAQMEAVSFGKEKPKAEGANEAAWAENRRADIAYSGK